MRSPSQLKDFPIEIVSLIKLTYTLNTLFPLETFFHWESAQKKHEKVHKKLCYCVDTCVCDDFVYLFHFFGIWFSVKFKNFFIIKTLFQILHVFVLLYKDKLKVQRVCYALPSCTFMLHFFYRKILVTIFNLKYTCDLFKNFLYNQSTISNWSEQNKTKQNTQNKTMKLSVLKSATCEPCLQSWMLHCKK